MWVAALSTTDIGSVADSIALRIGSSHDVVVRDGTSVQVDSPDLSALAVGETQRTAIGFANDDVTISNGGTAQFTDTSCTMPALADIDALQIGRRGGTTSVSNAYIQQIRCFPVRKTNAELEALVGNS